MDALPLPLLTILLPAAAIVLGGLLVMATRAALHELQAPDGHAGTAPAPAGEAPPEPLAETISRAAARLAAFMGGRRHIEDVPLILVLGAGTIEVRRLIPGLGGAEFATTGAFGHGAVDIALGPDGAVASFPDGLLESPRWERRWSDLLHALARLRRDRPFDCLVVTIEAAMLSGPARRPDDALTMLGEQLYQMIWRAQRQSGWRVPVHLIVTGGEALTGFAATAARLPPATIREPFGWVVPYGLDTAFERRWIGEGIESLLCRLGAVQAQLLMQAPTVEEAEQLLVFPQAVATLSQPLSVLLTSTLRQSAYHQPFMFRGFYLIGEATFAAKLFDGRIFPEHVLAQPIEGADSWRRRRIRLAQWLLAGLVLAGCFGLSRVSHNAAQVDTVRRLVDAIGSVDAESMVAATAPAATVTPQGPQPRRGAETELLLRLMAQTSLNRLETPWAPLSYLGDASLAVQRSIRASFETVVLRAIHERLTKAIPALLGVPGSFAATGGIDAGSCAAGDTGPADIRRAQNLMPRLAAYAQQLQVYQSLPEQPRIAALAPLLEFTLGLQLPAGFTTNYQLYEGGLSGAIEPPLQMGPIRGTVDPILATAVTRAVAASYPGSALARATDGAAAISSSQSGAPAIDRLRSLDGDLHTIAADAPSSASAWLAGRAPSATVAALLQSVDGTASTSADSLTPVDAGLPARLDAAARDCFAQTQKRLNAARLFGTIPLFAFGKDGAVAMAPALAPVLRALDGFLALPLATAQPRTILPPASGTLGWNTGDMLSIQGVAEAYLGYRAQYLPASLPSELNRLIQSAAGAQLAQLAKTAIQRAGQTSDVASGGTTALREQIDQFATAAPVLTSLRVALRQAGEVATANRLDTLLFNQATGLLTQVNALLTGADPYQLADPSLSFWNGTPPLAAPAFGAATLAELVATLPARRDYIQALSQNYAAPLVGYLTQSEVIPTGTSAALLNRWKDIAATLDRYHRGGPGNGLSRLEQFIAADMDRITLTNCQQVAGASGTSSGWFSVTLQRIRRAVLTRCEAVQHHDTTAGYAALADAFNQTLAGRFPFGPATAPDADPGDVKRFFARFGPNLAGLLAQLAATPADERNRAAQFVSQLQQVQTALAPMLDNPAPNAPLTYDVGINFRTNIGSDPGASQIASASLSFGNRSLSWFAADKSLAWTSGQTVAIRLRWAADAPSEPAAITGMTRPAISGRTATFVDTGPWSLLRLIAAQTPPAAMLAQLSDRQPETLEFSLPLQRNSDAASGGVTNLATATLFMRLVLTATLHVPGQPDQHESITLPAFPGAAPGVIMARRSR